MFLKKEELMKNKEIKDELFGIEALKSHFQRVMSIQFDKLALPINNWRSVNIQLDKESSEPEREMEKFVPGSSRKPGICPNYGLIELCAEIMEIKPEELVKFDYFCGVVKGGLMIGGCHGRRKEVGGISEIPYWCCKAIKDLMSTALELAKTRKPVSIGKISDRPSKKEVEKVNRFHEASKKWWGGQDVLDAWRETVPKNVGMQIIKYSKSLLILTVQKLIDQLEEKTIGEGSALGFNSSCPVSPKYEHKQWLHID